MKQTKRITIPVSEKKPQPPEIQIHLPHIHEPREQTEVHPLYK